MPGYAATKVSCKARRIRREAGEVTIGGHYSIHIRTVNAQKYA